MQPFVDLQIPWASTYGNHDRSKRTSAREILQKEQSYNKAGGKKLAWTEAAVPGDNAKVGTSNYYIPVYSSSGGGDPKLVMVLWFFDSRAGHTKDGRLEDFVAPEVCAYTARPSLPLL